MRKLILNKIKLIKYFIEYLIFRIFYNAFSLMPIDFASNCGGLLLRTFGRFSKEDKNMRLNLKYIYPNISNKKMNNICAGVWDNFGRYIGEFAHINKITKDELTKRIKIKGIENLNNLKEQNAPFFIFAGHFANWDICLPRLLLEIDKVGVAYRGTNNPFINDYVINLRKSLGAKLFAKGTSGVKDLLWMIKNKYNILMLTDQKMNNGISVPFLSKDSMTAPAIAVIARHYNYPILPIQIKRISRSAKFELIFYEALEINKTDDKEKDIYNIMISINEYLSSWVEDAPEQWFWLHRRWGKDLK